MSDNSKIEWTDATWNFLAGCSKISPGCKNCYAIREAHRMAGNPNPKISTKYVGTTTENGKNWTGTINFDEYLLLKPLQWKRPRKIFVNSMSDLFHEDVPLPHVELAFAVMGVCDRHIFQVLTKRPSQMVSIVSAFHLFPDFSFTAVLPEFLYSEIGIKPDQIEAAQRRLNTWATNRFPNVWFGVSVEDRKSLSRIDLLREVPAQVRWLSIEPLLEDLGTIDLTGIHQVVVGGESGPGARPMHPDWVRSIRDQCLAAGVAFLFKQWGDWSVEHQTDVSLANVKETFQFDTYFYKYGKKKTGRLLDGRTWDEFPEVRNG